ncbi:TPA: proliferating cell nuclear antigen (pcna) [Candidatus Micrarchaeota archaeon]|nr:MAG: proliferating cell nuclear antigen (pcna) [Candidatus Micrarchaeota archaeon CG1_02_51_15]HII38943.1 proliferating cell nuclear antigen (pcna) [Candidatus Micrarchaeota archaeon]
MELVAANAKEFKQAIEAIVNLVDEGTFEVSSKGLHLRAMDPSQIAMVDFLLPKEAFATFDATEEITSLGINIVDFSKILARARSDEKLSISLEEKANKFVLEFNGKSKRSFKIPLIEISASAPREPKISFDATIKIKGGSLREMLKDAGLLSSHVVLQAHESEFVVEAHGDSGDLKIEAKSGGESVEEVKATTKSRAMFPFEYLDDITRACPDDQAATIELKSDSPIKVSYLVNQAKLSYYLAPRVEQA